MSSVQDNTGALLQEEDFVVDKGTSKALSSLGAGVVSVVAMIRVCVLVLPCPLQ